jgi:hypothetical protein
MSGMSTPSSREPEEILADEAMVRAHAAALQALARRYGVTRLRFASAGRLLGSVAEDRDMLDMIDFNIEASELLGAKISLFSDAVLANRNVSSDLVDATPL